MTAKKFPRIGNDAYPHLDTANPFARKVPFDYGRYDYTASIKLCCVPWPSDYRHVVNWQSASARDAWFDALEGHVIELDQGFTRTQTDSVRVNVPYDEALTYNYVFMKVPQLTQDRAINHEGSTGVRTVCAWIRDAIYYAPSATELVLDVDVWTTYLPHTTYPDMLLRRGHAPMYALEADDYLQNPIVWCTDLLTPDVNYGIPDITKGGDYLPLSTDELIYVIASTIPYNSFNTMRQAGTGSNTPATYSTDSARDGYQAVVSGYQWAANGKTYAGMRSPSRVTHADGSVPTGLWYYGAYAADVQDGFLDELFAAYPQMLMSVQACYVVPSDLVTVGGGHIFGSYTLYNITSNYQMQDVGSFDIDKELFGYPARYADIAKLYTSPYAMLELSDDMGNAIPIRVEDTNGSINVKQHFCAAFPMLSWDVMVTNVASRADDVSYVWQGLSGAGGRTIPGADFAQYLMSYDIPTYALYQEARTAGAVSGYADAQAARARALTGYENTARGLNTSRENTLDADLTTKTNADASADTAKSNADASADTAHTNALASNATAKANADRSATTAKTNTTNTTAAQTSNAALQNDLRSDTNTINHLTLDELLDLQNQNVYDTTNADLEYSSQAADINLKSEAITSVQNILGNAITGNAVGMLSSAVSGIVNITTSSTLQQLSMYNITDHQSISQTYNRDTTAEQKGNQNVVVGYQNQTNTNTTANSVTAQNTNATNTETTTKANAAATKTTGDANAGRTQTTTKANASATQATTKANATRSKNTGDANASYARGTSLASAQRTLENAQATYTAGIDAQGVQPARAYGPYSGSADHESYQNRGVHLRAKTQSASAIARAGDTFIRYGYQYDGLWKVTSWCPAGHDYCYWQSDEVLVNAATIDNVQAERTYEQILANGVTVWNDPAKIGGVL
jgi:hypothetical protein